MTGEGAGGPGHVESRGGVARPWRIWVTRAAPGASTTAAALRALGHRPLTAPLIVAEPLATAAPDLSGVAALAFTSAAGVRAFARAGVGRDLPVFAVGAATAAAAAAAGFARVRHADGGARDLAALIAAAPPSGPVLAPGAREPAVDLPALLRAAGVAAVAVPVYATVTVTPPPARVLALLAAGRIDAVLLQSASAARALEAAVGDRAVGRSPELLALSVACLPRTLAWPARVAAAPRERDLLALPPRLDTPPPGR